ncbi:DNA repair and recombination protein RAD54 [Symbiodinium microadriaticum]|uniref:DNA repair and recombination protein RAD54 n=1 Tax=Symbiodinium microadriaticum TaxID=2951 RepID=A0A1Q9DAQ7_SYMMI|nr:DNA repair and recombination protein RAD54 [Symbiodinium microadriaticum]
MHGADVAAKSKDSVGQEEGSIAWTLLHILYNFLMTTQDNSRSRYHLPELYRSFLKSNVARKLLEDQNCKMTRSVLCTIRKLQGSRENVLELIQACDQGEQAQVARILRRPQDVNTLMPLPNNNDEDTSDDDSEYGDRVAVAVVVVVVVVVVGAGFDDDETRAMFADIDRLDSRQKPENRPVHEDRIVIISNWTQTLDLIEKLCAPGAQHKWPTHRLDGTMAINKRMKLVQDFNRPENEQAFAFLLSSFLESTAYLNPILLMI